MMKSSPRSTKTSHWCLHVLANRRLFVWITITVLMLIPLYVGIIKILQVEFIEWNCLSWKKCESIEKGNSLILCVNTFHVKNGRLPNTLEELVPDYCPAIPLPVMGSKRWDYWIQQDKVHFHLGFATTSGYPCYFYDSTYPEIGWYADN